MPADSRPNILIFQNDQEWGGVLEPGHPCRTPNADRLAAQGIRFSQAYTIAAHCCPSRATFMSGLYPSRHGIYNNVLNPAAINTSLKPGVTLFSEVLRDAGYALAYAGKWHVCADEQPRDRGWQQYLATAVTPEKHGLDWETWRERALSPEDDRPRGRGEIIRPGWGRFRTYGTRPTDPACAPYDPGDYRIVQTGIRAMQDLAQGNQPWCVYIGPNGPHDPYIIPEHYATMYDPADVPLPASFDDDLADKPRIYQRQRQQVWGQMGADEYREAIAHYWGFCTMQDDLLGLALEALEATGQAENTLVLFSSDHGDYAGAHGLFAKGVAAFDECYQVPCVMRWPAGISQPGRTVEAFVNHADMAPTFAALAGAAMPETSGRSLLPWLNNEAPQDWPDAVYSQFNGVELYYTQRFVRTHEWKYVYNGFDWDELYDLHRDPHCLRNLACDPAYADTVREMCRRMWQFAYAERDTASNSYITVGLAPYGPMEGWGEE
ncbi:MAG: sulfatase-like hydrolase/transferase [Anaerolineae bacterium]